jgi:molecular chaperone GrpE
MEDEKTAQQQAEKKEEHVDELAQALEAERKRSEEYLTRMKYAQADLENLKKRTAREIEEARKYCTERLVLELLEVVDELEMALKAGRSSESANSVVEGVEMTLKKLNKALEKEQVFPIECVGKPFDPSKHNAVARKEQEGAEECKISEEVRKGYVMKGKVIRPSIVKVLVKPPTESQTEEEVKPDE